MSWTLRVTEALADSMRADLSREHPFAGERVGFAYGTTEPAGNGHWIVLLTEYHPLEDSRYIDDPSVGARIDGAAIRAAMQRAMSHNRASFHAHMHINRGQPAFSPEDRRGIPPIVNSLRAACPHQAHGALLLSRDVVTAAVWLPGGRPPHASGKTVVVGSRLAQAPGLRIDG